MDTFDHSHRPASHRRASTLRRRLGVAAIVIGGACVLLPTVAAATGPVKPVDVTNSVTADKMKVADRNAAAAAALIKG